MIVEPRAPGRPVSKEILVGVAAEDMGVSNG